ncbi:hypothetical protein BBJ28_00005660 [Nothophytophthora sp. Chile5]|nr:hypothetical protein BBJ28_00005660 [Nothophytophthora sp. Chile5]
MEPPSVLRSTSVDAVKGVTKPYRVRFRSKERSESSASMTSSLASSSNNSIPKARVHVNDAELCARAEAVARGMDFRGLTGTDESRCRWVPKKSRGSFTTYARRPEAVVMANPASSYGPRHVPGKIVTTQQVLAAGEMRCSLQEVTRVLHTSSDFDHNAVMSGLYRKDFIYGSVVHVVPSESSEDVPLADLLQEEDSNAAQVSVKTGTFVHRKLFAPNEQWCFLERAKYTRGDSSSESSTNAFTLTLSTLNANELAAGKVSAHGRVDMLHDVSAGYLVEQVPGSSYVRVIFFGQFDGDESNEPGRAGPAQARARLMRLAEGTSRLPDVVRRRRFGAQTLADRAAFPARNSHCVCCTKSLRLLTRKHRCHLCGHFVCDRCWSVQEMETQSARRVTPVRVCSRCLEFVDNGDYSAVQLSALGPIEVKRDPAGRLPASQTLARLLREALRTSTGAKKESVRTVIQYLVNQEEEAQSKTDAEAKNRTTRLTTDSTEQDYQKALDGRLNVPQVPLYQCVLANSDKREYPIKMPKTVKGGLVPDTPIPHDEEIRLAAISRSRVLELEGASELDMLCSLAASELDCKFSIVTVVTAQHMTVLGSNMAPLRQLQLPREHSFCQHAIMSNKPLLVPHPEADVRFQNISGRIAHDLRFYCGFPLVADDKRTVIGSFCCLDQKSHDLTQSQYSAMKKLADAAAQVVRTKTRELRAASPNGASRDTVDSVL